MTECKEIQADPVVVSVYQLRKVGDLILKKLDQVEAGARPDASFQVLQKRLLNFSAAFAPKSEDILKSLAHHLMQIEPFGTKNRIEFMRSLVRELFDLYQTESIAYHVTSEARSDHGGHRPDFIAQRMNQASLVHDPKKLVQEHPPKKEKSG